MILPSNSYLTPELSAEEKGRLFRLMGFIEEPWLFSEFIDEELVMALRVTRTEILSEPSITSKLMWNEQFKSQSIPMITRHRRSETLTQSWGLGQGLWQMLLPYPVSCVAELWAVENGKTESNTLSLKERFMEQWESLAKLESELCRTELTLFLLQKGLDRMPILFHCVRDKCIRVGTQSDLEDLVTDESMLTPPQLRSHFGRTVQYRKIEIEEHGSPGISRFLMC